MTTQTETRQSPESSLVLTADQEKSERTKLAADVVQAAKGYKDLDPKLIGYCEFFGNVIEEHKTVLDASYNHFVADIFVALPQTERIALEGKYNGALSAVLESRSQQ